MVETNGNEKRPQPNEHVLYVDTSGRSGSGYYDPEFAGGGAVVEYYCSEGDSYEEWENVKLWIGGNQLEAAQW